MGSYSYDNGKNSGEIDKKTKILEKAIPKENTIFYTTFLIIFVILSIIGLDKITFEKATTNLLDSIITNFGFLYLIIVLVIALVCLFLCCSSYGNIKLGKDNSKPEYSNLSWFSMLFSAGMGVGLVFFGVAEPMTHYAYPIGGIDGGTKEAIDFAFKTSFFHWGIHPWAIYSFLALAMAYFQFRKGEKGLISSLFSPILKGKSYEKKVKTIIDIITIVTVIFIASALGSLDKGIKILSNINVLISVVLLLMVIILGPTISIFNVFSENLGNYLNNFLKISLKTNSFGDNKWMSTWTIFYWSNWVAWTPFVGTFIARISKGRTIREFVIGVVIIPSIVSFIWFSAFGTLGITLGKEFATVAVENTETALFLVFGQYRFGALMSGIAILLLGSFFITSADSATYVLGMMSSDGDLNPPSYKKLIWGITQSLLAIALIFAGGLNMLKTASIIIAFPLLILFPIMIFTMFYSLKRDMYIKKQIALRNELRKMSLEEISDISDAIKSIKK